MTSRVLPSRQVYAAVRVLVGFYRIDEEFPPSQSLSTTKWPGHADGKTRGDSSRTGDSLFMIYIVGGFFVAIVAAAVPLVFIPGMRVPGYLDISIACKAILEDPQACKAGAEVAGYEMVGGLIFALGLALAMATRWKPRAEPRTLVSGTYSAALAIVTVLVGAHIVAQFRGPYAISRVANITRESTFISLENLTWPLLLQLMNSHQRLRDKILLLSLLMPVVALSPFRAIVLAVMLFGFVLPICERWWGRVRLDRFTGSDSVKYAVASLVALLLLSALVYTQTRSRVEGTGGSSGAQPLRAQTESSIVQRLTYPLFQAHLAAVVSAHQPVPTIMNDVLKKLRLGRAPNLNEYLYGLVYGAGTVGEMTSLYYGEAAAYSKSPPMLWITVAPLLMVAAWLLFRQRGYETGTLVGIAIWRGSLGGFVDVVPALALQVLAMVALHRSPDGAKSTT